MFAFIKNHFFSFYTILFIFFTSCQLQEPSKNHGIVFLENRSKQLLVNKSNKNDVIKIMGQPHSSSIRNDNTWIYLERTLSKGKYHKLGQHVLKKNNTLVLNFDKFGILVSKQIYNKNNINELKFSEKKTENKLSKKSFVGAFLQSVKQKMYGNKK